MEIKEKKDPEKLILLSNRYGVSNYLRKVKERTYKYEGEEDYIRVGYGNGENKKKIEFIDPSGGPFLSVGSEVFGIEGKINNIKSTDSGFILTFE